MAQLNTLTSNSASNLTNSDPLCLYLSLSSYDDDVDDMGWSRNQPKWQYSEWRDRDVDRDAQWAAEEVKDKKTVCVSVSVSLSFSLSLSVSLSLSLCLSFSLSLLDTLTHLHRRRKRISWLRSGLMKTSRPGLYRGGEERQPNRIQQSELGT